MKPDLVPSRVRLLLVYGGRSLPLSRDHATTDQPVGPTRPHLGRDRHELPAEDDRVGVVEAIMEQDLDHDRLDCHGAEARALPRSLRTHLEPAI